MRELRIVVAEDGSTWRVSLTDAATGEPIEDAETGEPVKPGLVDPLLARDGSHEFEIGGVRLTLAGLDGPLGSPTSSAHARCIGEYLFQLFVPAAVREAWQALRTQHGEGVSTLIEVQPDALRSLPWELLHDGQMHLFQHGQHPVGLRIADGRVRPASVHWPLRMLIIVGEADPQIHAEAEVAAILRAISAFSLRIDLMVRRPPISKDQAVALIGEIKPHVFHFIGHGRARNGGELLLETGAGKEVWRREEIQALLTQMGPDEIPRIAVINACESGGSGAIASNRSIADAFAAMGCPMVISMRGEVYGEPAARFAYGFYRGLAEKGIDRPDQAYAQAIFKVSNSNLATQAWAQPRIYFQGGCGDVLPGLDDPKSFVDAARDYDDLVRIKPFVDREGERKRLYSDADAWLYGANRLLVVHGDAKVGKSWLLRSVLYGASLRGIQTFCWDFRDPPPDRADHGSLNYDLQDVLQALRQGKDWEFFAHPLYRGSATGINPFADFDARMLGSTSAVRGDDDHQTSKVTAFVDGLLKLAEGPPRRPLVIALDHIEKIPEKLWTDYLLRPLVTRIARDRSADVRLAIALNSSELAKYGLDRLRPEPQTAQVTLFSGARFEDLAFRYLLHFVDRDDDAMLDEFRQIVSALARRYKDPWKPEVFELTARVARAQG